VSQRRRESPWQAPGDPNEGKLWLTWLARLRWLALFAQAVTLAFVFHLLHGAPALVVWVGTMAMLALLNLWTVGRLAQTEDVPPPGSSASCSPTSPP